MFWLLLIPLLFTGLSVAAQQKFDIQHYQFSIELSDKSDAITGSAVISIKFLSDVAQVKLDLVSIQDDKGMYAFQVKEGKETLKTTHSEDILTITLGRAAKKNEVRTFEINYMGTPKDGLIISKNKYGDRTFFADNWPNRAHHWIPCIDNPGDKASFEFLVTVPNAYQVISNGVLIKSAAAEGAKTFFHWKETIPLSTKVMVIGVAKFAIKQYVDSFTRIPISAWVYPQDSTKGFFDYGVAPEIVAYFSEYIAPYPFRKLANVQSKTIFGGMENASAIFYSEESVTGERKKEDVVVHEIVHQWFGDMVSEKAFTHVWLSEGFATYLTNVYYQAKYGNDTFYARLQKDKKDVFQFIVKNHRPVVDSTKELMSLLNANSYQKGSWILHMLRNELGDSTFKKLIQSFYKAYAGSNADTKDFQRIAEVISQKELTWFFDQWLYRPGIPELDIDIKKDNDGVKIQIKQLKQLYRLTVEARILWADGKYTLHKIQVRNKETTFKLKGKGIDKVVIDPDMKLLYKGNE